MFWRLQAQIKALFLSRLMVWVWVSTSWNLIGNFGKEFLLCPQLEVDCWQTPSVTTNFLVQSGNAKGLGCNTIALSRLGWNSLIYKDFKGRIQLKMSKLCAQTHFPLLCSCISFLLWAFRAAQWSIGMISGSVDNWRGTCLQQQRNHHFPLILAWWWWWLAGQWEKWQSGDSRQRSDAQWCPSLEDSALHPMVTLHELSLPSFLMK